MGLGLGGQPHLHFAWPPRGCEAFRCLMAGLDRACISGRHGKQYGNICFFGLCEDCPFVVERASLNGELLTLWSRSYPDHERIDCYRRAMRIGLAVQFKFVSDQSLDLSFFRACFPVASSGPNRRRVPNTRSDSENERDPVRQPDIRAASEIATN